MVAVEDVMDKEKAKELLVYIASKVGADAGSIKLNKILFFSDVTYLSRYGKTISSFTYQKNTFGPTPRGVLALLHELEVEGRVINTAIYTPRYEKVVLAKDQANKDKFSGSEISVVDEMVEWIRPMKAGDASLWSHDFLGYKLADDGEDVSLDAVFLDSQELTREEKDYALQLISAP
jgi:hypothetical protein